MAWNQPGGAGNKDPWGKRKSSGQFDLDQALRNLQNRISAIFGSGGGGDGDAGGRSMGIGLILGVALAVWMATGFYIVQQGERGVVLRFGQKTEITEAGLHWRLPFPVERVEKVNVEKVSTVEVGYRSNPRSGTKNKVPKEALMLTQDENIIDIEFAVQYKINDPAAFLFNVYNPPGDMEMTIRQATESAVREVVGKNTLDFALTEGRDEVSRGAKESLQKILDRYQAGIQVVAVETQKAQPPEEVKTAFDDAVRAREDEQRLKNEAEAYANDIIPRARGAAARLVQEAEGYKASTIARADGDARRFSQVANEYVKAPAVTRERLYIETMEQVMTNTTKIFVDQKGGNNVLYLPLDKLMPNGAARAGSAPVEAEPPQRETGGAQRGGRAELRNRKSAP
ncbi:MAG TPA: FtsH protease activity modulator HflK [Burkholderiales bacterium]|nr:FtsH protease activity modulator HflK [Burkholderiales bacterium]